jgi:small subunit ribosomal protein S2
VADACVEGSEQLAEKKQAEADKAEAEVDETIAAAEDLKPGERKVISDGTEGPVVEIIKRTASVEAEEEVVSED